jgi:serine/threonine protein kinase
VSTQSSTLTDQATPGVIADRYSLTRRIGKGASGVVFRAYDNLLKVEIAIKILKGEYMVHRDAVERFKQEVLLARDIGHPNILRIYHLGESENRLYLTMKLVEGPTLARWITKQGNIQFTQVIRLIKKLASALDALHSAKILHRDLKPQNILLDEAEEPYLVDFGLARLQGEPGLTQGGVFLGPPDYASPEPARLEPLDSRSDLYSLGVIFYELATGQRPFRARSSREALQMRLEQDPPDPRTLRESISPELAEVILRCLQRELADRYGSAAELLATLEKV